MRPDCITKNEDQFKQVYCPWCKDTPYSSAKIGEDDYLQTQIWKKKREQRMKKDNYQCQKCGTAKNLVIHHIRYPAAWGMEDIDDLLTLCDRCHALVHERDLNTI